VYATPPEWLPGVGRSSPLPSPPLSRWEREKGARTDPDKLSTGETENGAMARAMRQSRGG